MTPSNEMNSSANAGQPLFGLGTNNTEEFIKLCDHILSHEEQHTQANFDKLCEIAENKGEITKSFAIRKRAIQSVGTLSIENSKFAEKGAEVLHRISEHSSEDLQKFAGPAFHDVLRHNPDFKEKYGFKGVVPEWKPPKP